MIHDKGVFWQHDGDSHLDAGPGQPQAWAWATGPAPRLLDIRPVNHG